MTGVSLDQDLRDRLKSKRQQVEALVAAKGKAQRLRTEVVSLRDDLERLHRRLTGFQAAGKKPIELISSVVHPDYGILIDFVGHSKLTGDQLTEQARADIAHVEREIERRKRLVEELLGGSDS